MYREYESAIKFDVSSSSKKSIFQNVLKMVIFTIPYGTNFFPEHFQRPGPRNSRSQMPITLHSIYNIGTFEKKISDPFNFAEFFKFFMFLTQLVRASIPGRER